MYNQIFRANKVMIGHKYICRSMDIIGQYTFYALFSPLCPSCSGKQNEVCKNTLLCYEGYLCGYFCEIFFIRFFIKHFEIKKC